MAFRGFNNARDLYDFQEERAQRGNAALKVWQRDLRRGQFAMVLIVHQAREPWPIWWEVLGGQTRDEREPDRVAGELPVSYANVFVRAYSTLDPFGREMQAPVGDAWAMVDRALFDQAKAAQWKLPPVLRQHFDFAFQRHAELQKGGRP